MLRMLPHDTIRTATARRLGTAVLVATSLLLSACGSGTDGSTGTTTTKPTDPATVEALQGVVDADAAVIPSSPGQLLAVLAPGEDVDTAVATGSVDFDGEPLTPDATVRIASVTKTFVAAAALRAAEEGIIDLDTSLEASGLDPGLLAALRADGYDTAAITIAQLLRHTSGIADFAGADQPAGTSAYAQAITADPRREWTAADQVEFAMANGEPQGAPGASFHYSDTGYVLAGQILEAAAGSDLATAVRTLLDFERLGLTSTYFESTEQRSPSTGDRAVQYLGEQRLNDLPASIDQFGGGGLISTMSDLATFFGALFRGDVFERAESLERMTELDPTVEPNAAMGLFATTTDGSTPCWYHEGLWGLVVITCPSVDITIARSWNQATPDAGYDPNDAVLATLRVLAERQESS